MSVLRHLPDTNIVVTHRVEPRLRQYLSFQTSLILEKLPSELASIIHEIESDQLFWQLCHPERVIDKIVSFERSPLMKFTPSFYQLNENIIADSTNPSANLFLEKSKKLLALIRKIGPENFERYFLYDESGLSPSEIANKLALSIKQVRDIFNFVNEFSIYNEFYYRSEIPAPEIHYTLIAKIEPDGNILYFSPQYARGRYSINYERLDEMKRNSRFSTEQFKHVTLLLRKMKLVNQAHDYLERTLKMAVTIQNKYVATGDFNSLCPLTLREVARQLGTSPSTITRTIYGKSIRICNNKEISLRDLFVSRKILTRKIVEDIISRSKGHITDEQVREILKQRHSIVLSRRSVNQYRKENRQQYVHASNKSC